MTTRRHVTGQFVLPIPAADAIGFFTPEGERSWARGWDPIYPTGEPTEGSGTVFITDHGGVETIWVIEKINRNAHTSAYSRITAGHHAGTVRVRCDDRPGDECVVSVEYDMTALSPENTLSEYSEAAFEDLMTQWNEAVRRTI